MKQEKLSVLFFILKGRTLKSGEAPILLRATVGGDYDEARIQRSVPAHLWDQAKGRCKGKSREANELNDYISSLNVKLLTIHKELMLEEALITPKLLLKKLFSQEEKRTVHKSFLQHNDDCRKQIGINYEAVTINRYDNCARSLVSFIQIEYGKEDISFAELNGAFIRRFEVFLKVEKRLCQNTVVRYMKCFKKFVNVSIANDWIKKDPFLGIKFKQEETLPVFLTKEELDLLIAKEFSVERLTLVRDLFIFSSYTGLAFVDAKELRPEHLFKDNDGNLWIRKGRHKMRRSQANCISNVPLLDMAKQILEKYSNHPVCVQKGVCLPVLSNQKMNSYLKEIADFCGIKKNLTTHAARHTFSTTITLANKVSLENVAKMLGHTSTRMTQHYAQVLDQNIMEDMMNVEKRLSVSQNL